MRNLFLKIFSATTGSISIELFSVWHFLYLFIIIGGTLGIAWLFKDKSQEKKQFTLKLLAWLVPATYIADFLLMPLARTDFSIDVDKLPFHVCTLMAFFIPFAQFNKKFEPVKDTICCLSLAGSLMYVVYPGSAIGNILPWSYKVIQTFLYHGFMFAWSTLSLSFGSIEFRFNQLWKCAVGILLIIVWASFGNAVYSHEGHHFDWFFITGSAFPFIPSPLMPAVVFIAVFGMCALLHAIYYYARKYFTVTYPQKHMIVNEN